MAAKITVATVDHTADLDGTFPIRINLLQNGRSRMTFRCVSGYNPARFAAVVAYAKDGTTPIYGGLILQRTMQGLAEGAVSSRMGCEVVGFETYLDWCYLDLTFATATTLQAVLNAIIAALPAGYGITLDATDYSGIALAPFTWTTMRASDGLRELCDRTGRIYQVSPLKVLSMPLPGGTAAPVAGITNATPNCRDLIWRDAAAPAVTTVTVLCGTGQAWVTQSWTQAGGATSWQTDIPAAGPTAGYATLNGLFCTVTPLVGDNAYFNWTAATHTLSVGTLGSTPANGSVITLSYLAQYPFAATATTGATPPIQAVYTRTDVFGLAQGQEIAAGLLAAQGGSPRTVTIPTLVDGWAPGQSIPVNITGRAVDATFAVTAVDIEWVTLGFWAYLVTAVELSVFPGSYLDQWRALLAGSSSGGTTTGSSSGVSVVGGALPTYCLGGSRFHAVQVPS